MASSLQPLFTSHNLIVESSVMLRTSCIFHGFSEKWENCLFVTVGCCTRELHCPGLLKSSTKKNFDVVLCSRCNTDSTFIPF